MIQDSLCQVHLTSHDACIEIFGNNDEKVDIEHQTKQTQLIVGRQCEWDHLTLAKHGEETPTRLCEKKCKGVFTQQPHIHC